MRTVKFSPLYLAGFMAGAGVALFFTFLVSTVEGVGFSGLPRLIIASVGLLLLISGGIWNIRLQGKDEGAN